MVTSPYDKYFGAERLKYKHSIKLRLWCLFLHCSFVFVCSEFCFFLFGGGGVQLENMLHVWKCYHCRWRAAIFHLYSALNAIDHWRFGGFFCMPHLLWHGISIRGSVTFTSFNVWQRSFVSQLLEQRSCTCEENALQSEPLQQYAFI